MIVTRCYKYQLHPEARKLPCKEAIDVSLLKFRVHRLPQLCGKKLENEEMNQWLLAEAVSSLE